MRVLIRMSFYQFEPPLPFEQEWNAQARRRSNRMDFGNIRLWEDDPDYPKFMSLVEKNKDAGLMLKASSRETVYTHAELLAFDLLEVSFGGWIEASGEDSFDVVELCSGCRRSQLRQISDLVAKSTVDRRDASFGFIDVPECRSVAWAVSARLRAFLEDQHLAGVTFRPVVAAAKGKTDDVFQLIVSGTAPPLDSRTKLEVEACCPQCLNPLQIWQPRTSETKDSELHFPKFDLEQSPMVRTREAFGSRFLISDPNHHLVISGPLYGRLASAGFSGIAANPAHLV